MKKFMSLVLAMSLMTSAAMASDEQMESVEAKGAVELQLGYKSRSLNGAGTVSRIGFGIATFGIGLFVPCGGSDDWCFTEVSNKQKRVSTPLRAVVNPYGEGRVMVLLNSESRKSCAPFQLQAVGLETATNTYELRTYQLESGELSIGETIGLMTLTSKEVFINFGEEASFVTRGKRSDCVWSISKDTAIALKRNK